MTQLYRFIYTSARHKDCTENDIQNILSKSQANNKKRGLTGLLVFTEKRFLQVLEGEKTEIESLYDVILKDDRHLAARQRYIAPIEERLFPDWAMGSKDASTEQLKLEGDQTSNNIYNDLLTGGLDMSSTDDRKIMNAFFKLA